jgi:signal transduction histidine kinase
MRFTGKFIATLGAALAILIVVGVLSYRELLQETKDQHWVDHTHLVLETLDAVDLDVINTETWQRGFLITGDGQFLQLYERARIQLEIDLDDVRDLTVDNAAQEVALVNLRMLIIEKINGLQNRIGLRQEGGLETAAEAMKEEHVQELTTEVRTAVANMKDSERQLLQQRTTSAVTGSLAVARLIISGNLVAFLFLFTAGMFTRTEFAKRVAAEQVALKKGQELTASNKELEAFCYSVSHDLRAPLRGIDGFSQALIEDYGNQLDEQGRNYLIRVRAGTQRMGMLIDDLLNLSRLTRAELQRVPVNLSSVADVVAKDIFTAQPSRNVDVKIAPNLSTNADPRLMRIVFENLLGNAWKFTSKSPHARIEVGSAPHNGSPAYFVRDNGAGFNPEYASRLFGAFQRLHRSDEFPGTGIGLATVQRIIHRHGGQIWAKSDPGKGATFYFTLDPTKHMEARHA